MGKNKRNNRNRKSSKRSTVSKGNKKLKFLIGLLFFAGMMLLIWEVKLYQSTIIELKIPLSIGLLPGLILTPLLYNKLNQIEGRAYHWLLHYLLHCTITGAFLLFTFMATNFYLSDETTEKKDFMVTKKGSLAGRSSQPYIMIDYNGMEKQLVFPPKERQQIKNASHISLKVKKGFFGFEVLESYEIY